MRRQARAVSWGSLLTCGYILPTHEKSAALCRNGAQISFTIGAGQASLFIALDIELEVHNIAVLHNIVLAFLAQLARRAAACFPAKFVIISKAGSLRFDKSALEVCVDHTCCLRRLGTNRHGPGARLVFATREKALQTEQVIGLTHQT